MDQEPQLIAGACRPREGRTGDFIRTHIHGSGNNASISLKVSADATRNEAVRPLVDNDTGGCQVIITGSRGCGTA
jgi:hypothetical protein